MKIFFSRSEENKGRQKELDIAKGLAIVFTVLVHVNEVYASKSLEHSNYSRVVEFLGSPPAAQCLCFY